MIGRAVIKISEYISRFKLGAGVLPLEFTPQIVRWPQHGQIFIVRFAITGHGSGANFVLVDA